MHIACSSDAHYLPHVATLMQSLAASNPAPTLTLHLLHDDTVTRDLQTRLHREADRLGLGLTLHRPAPASGLLPPSGSHYPALIWYRIMLPELLETLDRVLYLDADTLVLQDLRAMWSVNLDGSLVAAVAQPPETEHSTAALARLGLPAEPGYFNSGVLLMNLRAMREEGFSRQIFEIAHAQTRRWQDSPHFQLPDQDALNSVCAGKWVTLHPKWNCLASLYLSREVKPLVRNNVMGFGEAVASPGIVHFEGSGFAKPWNYRCVHPLRHLYREYRRKTPWPIEQLEGAHLAARILRPLPPSLQLRVAKLKPRALRS